ncbi:hypothetical protein MNBD_IGNAVI01-3073, partial [hydrothermal vent metagenome]
MKSQTKNSQNSTLKNKKIDLLDFFKKTSSQRQKQYEAVRAIVLEKQPLQSVANLFGYKLSTLYSLLRDAKAGKVELFPVVRKGPKEKRTPLEVRDKIVLLRKKGLSSEDIVRELKKEKIIISARTIERVLKEAGFSKLKRRSFK